MSNFFGGSEFWWWCGVVEDRMDPLYLGRCRVRIVGYHTADRTLLPTGDLPWASVLQPITSAAMTGIGHAPVGPVEGTWVVGFFRDGSENQEPIIMGTIGGIPQSEYYNNLAPQYGFRDETNQYPDEDLLDEPDTNRLARNEKISKTIIQLKNDAVVKKVPVGITQGKWDQPKSSYDAVYPYNHVFQSESGHVTEYDDTPNNERTHQYHRAGTFVEIDKNGTRVTRIVGDDYEILDRDGYVLIKGTSNVTINGDSNVYVKNNCRLEVDGSMDTHVHQDYKLNVAGQYEVSAGGNVSIKSKKRMHLISVLGMLFQARTWVAQALTTAAINSKSFGMSALFFQNNLTINPMSTKATAEACLAAAGDHDFESPVDPKTPSLPTLPDLGFNLSPSQRRSYEKEMNEALREGPRNISAVEYASLKKEELGSNKMVSAPIKDDPAATNNTSKDYKCAAGLRVVEAARRDLGMIETSSPPGKNYGGKVGGGELPEGVSGRIDDMFKLCGIDNMAKVRSTGSGNFWCSAAVTAWWKEAGLPIPPGPAACRNWESWAKKNGYFSNTPKVGAAILYGPPGGAHHIGIVSSVSDNGSITTIEGNTSGGIFARNGCGCFSKKPRSYLGFVIPPTCV